MADRRLSVRDRVQVLDQLDATLLWLNRLSAWLGEREIESEADLLDQAARDIATACWLLERPLRPKPPPEAWKTAGTGLSVPSQQADGQREQAG